MSRRTHSRHTARTLVAAGVTAVVGLTAALSFAPSVSAQTLTQTFKATCTQGFVNGGAPFDVDVDLALTLPDEIYVGDEVFAEVEVDLTLPEVVADTIVGNWYETMRGAVDVTVLVTDPAGVATPRTAVAFPLAATAVPDPPADFPIVASPVFPSYIPNSQGTYTISISSDFVTVHSVVVSNSSGGEYSLNPFECTVATKIEVAALQVLPPTESTTAPTTEGGESSRPVVAG